MWHAAMDEQLWWRSAESSRTYGFETQMCSWVPRSTRALPEPASLSLLKRPSHVMCYFNGCSHRLASVASWGARNGRFITLIVHRGRDGPIRADCRCAKVTRREICQHNGCLLFLRRYMPFISHGTAVAFDRLSKLRRLICAIPAALNHNYN